MNDEAYYKYFGVWPIHTRGTEEGVILKYRCFYLKVYNESGTNYLVQGYRYGDQVPRFEDHISLTKMMEYASQFKSNSRKCV